MERTNDKRRWIKTEGNFFRMKGGKIIKKGQVFTASLDQIPEAFRDTIKPADGKAVEPTEEKPKLTETEPLSYSVKHRAGQWYDVINSEGKVVNEKALKKADAEELLETLQ